MNHTISGDLNIGVEGEKVLMDMALPVKINEINELVEGKASTFNGCLFIGEIIPDRGEMVIKYPNGKLGKMSESAFLEIYEPECSKENKEI